MTAASRCSKCGAGFVGTKCPHCKAPSPAKGPARRSSPQKVTQAPPSEPVGTHLASLIPDWAKSMKGGCSCKDWEAKMNRWGVAGCKNRREQIVSHLMSQQEHLAKPLQALPDVLKRVAAGKLVDIAIKRSTKD